MKEKPRVRIPFSEFSEDGQIHEALAALNLSMIEGSQTANGFRAHSLTDPNDVEFFAWKDYAIFTLSDLAKLGFEIGSHQAMEDAMGTEAFAEIAEWNEQGAASLDVEGTITCPQCGMTSSNRNDIVERYCGNCKQFHADIPLKK